MVFRTCPPFCKGGDNERKKMSLVLVFALSFQCMLNSLEVASTIAIKKDWSYIKYKKTPSKSHKKHLRKLLKLAWEEDGIDARIFAISWLESRLRPVTLGDQGRACGVFQIHARYSYPLFRRKGGFTGWDESSPEAKKQIQKECRKLLDIKYSMSTMRKLLSMMDKRDLHPCHHNSGFRGRCNTWYKERVSFWTAYFSLNEYLCKKDFQMPMLKTGNPIPTAPSQLVQGYLDAMANKEPASEDSVYKSGYDLANLVKKGEAEPPSWSVNE